MQSRKRSRVGIYYLLLRGQVERDLFSADADYRAFLDVCAGLLESTGYRLYAFCLLPGQIHLAVQMSQVPLADFTQRLILKFTHRMHTQGRKGALFGPSGDTRLIDDPVKQQELIRFIHLLPLKSNVDPREYPWSSHRTWLGKARLPCVDTRRGLHVFGPDCRQARDNYESFVSEGLELVRAKFSTSRVADGPVGEPPRINSVIGSLDQLVARIAELAQIGGRCVHDVRSSSRERLSSLLRALVTWHATRLEIATISEVCSYLNRDPSTLYASVKRYSFLYPHLFEAPGKLEGVASLANEKVNGRMNLAAAGPPEVPEERRLVG